MCNTECLWPKQKPEHNIDSNRNVWWNDYDIVYSYIDYIHILYALHNFHVSFSIWIYVRIVILRQYRNVVYVYIVP